METDKKQGNYGKAQNCKNSTVADCYLLNCPFCGHGIRTNTILGTAAFFCDGCFAEIKFREVGLHIDQQQERFNQRDNPWCGECEEDDCECSLDGTCNMIRKYLAGG